MPRCPGCFVMLTMTNYGGVNVKTCNSCFGTWISRVSLMHIVRAVEPPDAGPATPTLKDLAALVMEGHHKRPFPCPECRQQMALDRLHPMIPIDMQFCGKCNYVWLDVGKLALTQRLYYELANSTDPKIIEIRRTLRPGRPGHGNAQTACAIASQCASIWDGAGERHCRCPGYRGRVRFERTCGYADIVARVSKDDDEYCGYWNKSWTYL